MKVICTYIRGTLTGTFAFTLFREYEMLPDTLEMDGVRDIRDDQGVVWILNREDDGSWSLLTTERQAAFIEVTK